MLTAKTELFDTAEAELAALHGPIDLRSPLIDFDFTDHYEREMGAGLKRKFISFSEKIDPGGIAKIKLKTNELEQQLAAADTRELFWIVGQIGQLLTRERKAIVKYDEVVSTMLGGLEKRFNGETNDQMIAKIYANAARLADSPERGAARIEEFLKTYDGPASPLLKHVADSLRKSASGDAESDETVVTGSGLEF